MPKGQKTMVYYRGRRVCLKEAARMARMPYDRLRSRMSDGWTFREAIADPTPRVLANSIDVTIDGETHHIAEWCRIVGIDQTTVCARVRNGMTYEEAISKPNKCSPEATRKERRQQVLSLLLGGCPELIKHRLKSGWNRARAESTPVLHKWNRKSNAVWSAREELLKLGIIV